MCENGNVGSGSCRWPTWSPALKAVAFPQNLPSSSLACGFPSPAFIGNDGRIELSYSINFFVGDHSIIQREMEGSDEGEVSLKEVKNTVLLLAKQMVELKTGMSERSCCSRH